MRKTYLFALMLALALIAAACSSDSDETTTTEAQATTTTTTEAATTTTTAAPTTTTEAPPSVGTEENPIQVLFVPSVSAEDIIAGGDLLVAALNEATGLVYEVAVPTSYAATLNEICAAPENTIGMIPAQAYVLGAELCGIEVALKSKRFGFTEYWAQFLVQRDSDITSLEDLAGKSWAYPDPGSTSGWLVPSGMFGQAGIDVGEEFETGGHTGSARAVYNGEADFGTTFYSPGTDADGNVLWNGDAASADVPDDKIDACALDDEGEIDCDGFFPQDARRGLREEAPDVIQKVRIVTLSQPIPNDTMSFSAEFPSDLKEQIIAAMVAFAKNDPEGFEAAFDAYSWDDVAPTDDTEFDFIRQLVQQLGITVDDL